MNRKIFSFLVVSLFTVTAGCAVPSKSASQEIPKQNLPSEQVKGKVSQPIPVTLPADATISMKTGKKRRGRVVEIDEKSQKLWIQRSREKQQIPLSKIEKIMFGKSAPPPRTNGIRRSYAHNASSPFEWEDIPMSDFELKDAAQGEAVVKLEPPVVNREQLQDILKVPKDRQFVVDEMQFNVQKKTMTILATPTRRS